MDRTTQTTAQTNQGRQTTIMMLKKFKYILYIGVSKKLYQ